MENTWNSIWANTGQYTLQNML